MSDETTIRWKCHERDDGENVRVDTEITLPQSDVEFVLSRLVTGGYSSSSKNDIKKSLKDRAEKITIERRYY